MKKQVLISAAVAGLFATAAFAGAKTAMPKTEADCTKASKTWNSEKKECTCGANGCEGKASSTTSTTTTTTAPSATTTTPSTTAPAKTTK